jgi:hypothetical protein
MRASTPANELVRSSGTESHGWDCALQEVNSETHHSRGILVQRMAPALARQGQRPASGPQPWLGNSDREGCTVTRINRGSGWGGHEGSHTLEVHRSIGWSRNPWLGFRLARSER